MTISYATGSSFGAAGANAAPTATVPAGLAAGTVLLIALTEGAADAITATPAGLTLLDPTSYSTGTFPARLYSAVVGTGTGQIAAGASLAWTLSATKQWNIVGAGWAGVDTANPFPSVVGATAAATTTAVAPTTAALAEALLVVEAVVVKANGAAVSSITIPATYTQRAFQGSGSNSFGGAGVIAERTAGVGSVGSTYGGDTYTPGQATNVYTAWTVGLRAAGSGGATYTVPAGWREVRRFRKS